VADIAAACSGLSITSSYTRAMFGGGDGCSTITRGECQTLAFRFHLSAGVRRADPGGGRSGHTTARHPVRLPASEGPQTAPGTGGWVRWSGQPEADAQPRLLTISVTEADRFNA
jgi:hypothetical protein